jgi:hypothetical protein
MLGTRSRVSAESNGPRDRPWDADEPMHAQQYWHTCGRFGEKRRASLYGIRALMQTRCDRGGRQSVTWSRSHRKGLGMGRLQRGLDRNTDSRLNHPPREAPGSLISMSAGEASRTSAAAAATKGGSGSGVSERPLYSGSGPGRARWPFARSAEAQPNTPRVVLFRPAGVVRGQKEDGSF